MSKYNKYLGICRVIYNKTEDSYSLEIRNNGEDEWGTVMVAKCRPDSEGDPCMIHYTFLTRLLVTVSNGYELIN